MNIALQFSGDYNSERIFKISQYLTKLCVQHLGFTFLAHPVQCTLMIYWKMIIIPEENVTMDGL